jgi:uncharacterized protein YgiM (DUF1202 family)
MFFSKKCIFFIVLFLITSFSAVCQNINLLKKSADSLFVIKKYQESFLIYENILKNNKISPDMLLKMAFINEGLGNYTHALYYLNMYQLNFPSSTVLKKMDDLGVRHNLMGYEFTDYEYFVSVYNKFSSQILYVLVGISLFLFLYSTYRIFVSKNYIRARIYVAFIIMLFCYAFINLGIPSYKGIVSKDHTLIMDAPSAGSTILSTINKGHRLNILKKDEVWYEVLWNNKVGFVKHEQLYIIVNSRNAEQFNVFSIAYKFSKSAYKKGLEIIQDLLVSNE